MSSNHLKAAAKLARAAEAANLISATTTRARLELPPMYPKQYAAVCDPARIVVIEAATKAGKTVGCLMWLLSRAWNGGKGEYWWIAPTFAQSTMAFNRMVDWLQQGDPAKHAWDVNLSVVRIRLSNGANIWFKSADNADSLYGEDVQSAVIDEATRCSEASWYAIRSTLTATRGKLRIIGNVRGRKNWAFALARRAEAGERDMAYFKLTAYDAVEGGVVDAQEIEDAKRVLPEAIFRELYLAEPSDDGGNPFGIKAIAECVAPLSSLPVVCWGVDLAKSRDWTVAVGLDADGKVCQLERWQGAWSVTRERLARMIKDTPAQIDSTGVGDPIVEDLRKVCARAEGFRFSSQSKQQLMEGLQIAISTKEIRFPDGWLRAELESFGFRYTQKAIQYEATVGHDDGVCALALAVHARRQRHPFIIRVF